MYSYTNTTEFTYSNTYNNSSTYCYTNTWSNSNSYTRTCCYTNTWTWNGLDAAGITITRIVRLADGSDLTETAGVIQLPPVIGRDALKGVDADPRNPARQTSLDCLYGSKSSLGNRV